MDREEGRIERGRERKRKEIWGGIDMLAHGEKGKGTYIV
jgi:hypothetical protein